MAPYVWVFLILVSSVWFMDAIYDVLKKSSFYRQIRISRPASRAYSGIQPGKGGRRAAGSKQKLREWLERARSFVVHYNKGVLEFYEHDLGRGDTKTFAIGMGFLKVFWIFILANIFGSALETVWCILASGRFEMRTSMVYGFFIPIYGFGAMMMSICLCRFYRSKSFFIFLGGAFIGALVEYAASWFQEVFFKTRSWDYSNTPFNLDGRTNLMFALVWGVLGVVWVKFFYRLISTWIEKIPKKIGIILTIALFTFFILDSVLTTTALYRQIERHNGIPASNQFVKYLDQDFNDQYLDWVYPNMRYVEKQIS